MLWIFSSILVVLWLVGLIKEPMGGFIHILLVLAALAAGTELALLWRRQHEHQHSAISTQQPAPDFASAGDPEDVQNAVTHERPTTILGHGPLRRTG